MRIILTALALCLTFTAAQAQQCAPANRVLMGLATTYGEEMLATFEQEHPQQPETIVQWHLWANAETGSWTVFAVMPGGMACVAAVGEDFGPRVLQQFESMNGGPGAAAGEAL